ncbi:hypothetical protein [Streptomyces ossamyceticus]|uniref:hypothetical protein n=1 Tax=Streptomyces ossamyceticus TaxID=249581 RepID=UPI000B22AB22|nr:hypothetical protein [Streptomyces ossamyceticus]
MSEPFSFENAERTIGEAGMKAAERNAAEAPPISPTIRAQVRAVVASARAAPSTPSAVPAERDELVPDADA